MIPNGPVINKNRKYKKLITPRLWFQLYCRMSINISFTLYIENRWTNWQNAPNKMDSSPQPVTAVRVIRIPVRISGKRSIPAKATSATSSPQEVARTKYLDIFIKHKKWYREIHFTLIKLILLILLFKKLHNLPENSFLGHVSKY